MKQTLLSRLILAGLAGAALSVAQAGQIQASSTSIAREVITDDTQAIISPSVAYRFAGDIDPTVQAQVFQVQLTLNSTATWDTTVAPATTSVVITDGVSGTVAANGAVYTVTKLGYSTDKKTLYATITVPVGPIIKQPIFSFNGGTGTKAAVVGLKSVVGDLIADSNAGTCTATYSVPVAVQHFVALSTPTSIAAVGTNGVADEHTRSGATNSGTLLVFPTNILPVVTTSTAGVGLSPGGNFQFAYTGGLAAAAAGVAGAPQTSSYTGNAGDAIGTQNLIAYLGNVRFRQNASGYDTNATNTYALGNGGVNAVTQLATSATSAGNVEALKVVVDVAATNGFVVGGSLSLRTLPATAAVGVVGVSACSTAAVVTVPITAANASLASIPVTVSSQADLNTLFGATGLNVAQLCYTAPGGTAIPASQFSATTRIYKSPEGSVAPAFTGEQDNACKGPLFTLGGGLKIDVRNYASSAETSGYQSVVRIINASDITTADVYGQIIHQSGKFGPYGLLGTLAPRAVMNMTATEIDAKLTTAPNAGAANNGAAAPAAGAAAPRLRITSGTGASLRVQNYLFNSATNQILEGSNAQGVDFEGTTNRAPGADGQYISQDAQSGLNGK